MSPKKYYFFRKRSREEDLSDFMPLSKRINNLHIDNNNISCFDNPTAGILGAILTSGEQYHHYHNNNNNNMLHHNGFQSHNEMNHQGGGHQVLTDENSLPESEYSNGTGVSSHSEGLETMALGEYHPDLNADENPYYYTKNKLLYDLYVERMRRCPMNSY